MEKPIKVIRFYDIDRVLKEIVALSSYALGMSLSWPTKNTI
jgi:hypothetical protein